MHDTECVALLEWALPRLGLRWPGFRKVRRQVCKRIARRMADLQLSTGTEYRARLDADPAEWPVLDSLCRVTIARFFRDRAVWERIRGEVLPAAAHLARRTGADLRCWSAGCASGEEPYGLSFLLRTTVTPRFPELPLRVIATDVDEVVLGRAARACFEAASLRGLPVWAGEAFEPRDGSFCVRSEYRQDVELHRQDLRREMPDGPFHLVLCRNVAFTYFDDALQRHVLDGIAARVPPGGFLVVGAHEAVPADRGFIRLPGNAPIHVRGARPVGRPRPNGGTPGATCLGGHGA